MAKKVLHFPDIAAGLRCSSYRYWNVLSFSRALSKKQVDIVIVICHKSLYACANNSANHRKGGNIPMRTKICLLTLGICLAIMISIGTAEEKYGIIVYTGAKYDSGASDFLKQISPKSAAYRTGDSVGKVVDFYKKQAGFKLVGDPAKEGAMFRKGNMDVTIQSPYMDTKTGNMMKGTLISIVTRPE
jgi:hypothetical protein